MTATRWYIARDFANNHPASPETVTGPSVGPLTTAKLLELASSGKLRADVLVWMDGTDVLITLAQFQKTAAGGKLAGAEAPLANSAAAALPAEDALPDWLADVAQKESGELPRPAPQVDWLQDVMESENISTSSTKQAPQAPPRLPALLQTGAQTAPHRSPPVETALESRPTSGPALPSCPTGGTALPSRPPSDLASVPLDWLEDIRVIEESLRGTAPSRKDVPVKVLKMALPAPVQPAPPPRAPTPVQPAAPPPMAEASPLPSAPPPAFSEASGYNPETGEIVDPAAYARFQKAEAQRRQEELEKQPTLSVAEVFIEAHRALQEWVDADANRALVARGDMEPIRACPAVKNLLVRYENYGPVMQERLWKRLAVLVDNRKKFLKAFGIA